jgi:hypothetical protein
VQGVAALLKRQGWSCQMSARRAMERDEAAVAGWVKETCPRWKGHGGARRLARLRGRGRLLDDAADGPHLVPPRSHSRSGACGAAPAAAVAALACYKPGERSRLIYRPCLDARPDGRKRFSWKDYRDQGRLGVVLGSTAPGVELLS